MADEYRSDAIRNLILEKAAEYFLTYSYTNTTTEQIAIDLGISKKTLYKFFPRKEDLLFAVLRQIKEAINVKVDVIVSNPNLTFVEKMNELVRVFASFSASFTPQFYRDMEKVKPGLIKEYHNFPIAEFLLTEGVEQGIIRKDINLRLIMAFMSVSMEAMITYVSSKQSEFTLYEILELLPRFFMEGLLTDQGRAQIKVCC